jgi:hypothetical protein
VVLRRFLVGLAARTSVLAGITERAYIDIDSLLLSNGQVLTAHRRGTSSHQPSSLLTTSGRTVCRKTSRARREEC